MNWSLVFSPFIPWPVIAVVGVIALVLLLPGIFRRMRGAWFRLVAAAALILALANPILLNEQRDPQSTVVALVVDQSASQTLDNRETVTNAAAMALQQRLAEFKNVEGRTINAGGPQQGGLVDGAQLFGPLSTPPADVPPDRIGAVIMLTDGQVHDVPATRAALPPGAPLHVLLSGHDGEKDRRIVIDSAPRFGIVNEKQTIKYRVVDDGGSTVPAVRVTITRAGAPRSVETVAPVFPAQLTLDITHGGPNVIEFEAEPLAGELTPINNRAVIAIDGVRDKLRVLLVSGEPHAGERTWRNLLKSDASVDLVHFTILRPPEKQDGTPINELSLIAFPTRELFQQKINEFHLIIFDRYARQGVLPVIYFDNIARYVREGGAVLVAAGPGYASPTSIWRTPLHGGLPAEPSGRTTEIPYFAQLTDLGKRHPVTRGLEGAESDPPHWSQWFRLVDARTEKGTPVMKGPDDKPLLLLSREGEGRVALLLSDHIWLWARGYEGGGPHLDLLRRLSHWLMKQPDLEEEALRLGVRGKDIEIRRQTMADEVAQVTVTTPTGQSRTLTLDKTEPGVWKAVTQANELGLWRATDGKLTALVNVGPANPREYAEVTSSTTVLGPLANATGGEARRIADASGNLTIPRVLGVRSSDTYKGDDWLGLKMRDASVVRGIGVLPLFAGMLGLLLLIGSLAATWLREGR